MLYDQFKPIVDLVLNNWTALQLAVEHGMGAPGGEKTAQLMSVYVAQYCIDNVADVDALTECLEDLMDEEFETVCHDNSPKEVANLLLTFLTMLRAGQHEELKAQIDAMPKCQKWLSQPILQSVPPQCHGNPDDDTTSSSGEELDGMTENPVNAHQNLNGLQNSSNDHQNASNSHEPQNAASTSQDPEPMDEDGDGEPGWTVVRSRRKT